MAVKHKKRPTGTPQRVVWSDSHQNDLPDAAFAHIEPGGTKDANGRTVPRSKRHLPFKNMKGEIDKPHLRNALARLDQTDISAEAKATARTKLEAAAREAGVGDYTEGERAAMSADTPTIEPLDLTKMPIADIRRVIGSMYRDALEVEGSPEAQEILTALDLITRAASSDDDEEDEEEEDGEGEEEEDEEGDEDEDEAPAPPPSSKKKMHRTTDPTPALTRAASVTTFTPPSAQDARWYVPLNRVDTEKREIEGVLSDEQLDTFGTIFDYDSMKRAVQTRWHGNVREQHNPIKAVGKGVLAVCDDDQRVVTVRARISKGAEDTWQKILDGTLSGFSIGAANAKTDTRMVNNKAIPCYKDFDLAEISVVDAPSNPGAKKSGLTIYRSAIADAPEFYAEALEGDTEDAPVLAAATPETPPVAPAPAETPAPAPVTEDEIQARVAEAEAALLRGEEFGAPQMTGGTPAVNDTASGPPDQPTAAELDAIDHTMHADAGQTHVHAHAYTPATVHMDKNHHKHGDGNEHTHDHLHGHVGYGDGSKPHIHGHEHDHAFQRAAADHKADSFFGEADPRVDEYLSLTQRTQTPAALPVKSAETSGKAPNANFNLHVTTGTTPAQIATAVNEAMQQRTALAEAPLDATAPVINAPPPGLAGLGAQVRSTEITERIATPDETRYGQRISGDTRTGMHEGALAILRTCGCPTCQEACACFDPDMDGDDDVDAGGDTDNDAMLVMPRVQRAQLSRAVGHIIQQQMSPVLAQQRAITARLATIQAPDLTRMADELASLRASQDAAAERVTTILQTVEQIAEAEQKGGPVLRAAEKTLGTQPQPGQPRGMQPFSADQIQYLRSVGYTQAPTAEQQTALAQTMIRQQFGG